MDVQVNISLRVLTRPIPGKLPSIYRTLGTDYAERVLPSIIQVSNIIMHCSNLTGSSWPECTFHHWPDHDSVAMHAAGDLEERHCPVQCQPAAHHARGEANLPLLMLLTISVLFYHQLSLPLQPRPAACCHVKAAFSRFRAMAYACLTQSLEVQDEPCMVGNAC